MDIKNLGYEDVRSELEDVASQMNIASQEAASHRGQLNIKEAQLEYLRKLSGELNRRLDELEDWTPNGA